MIAIIGLGIVGNAIYIDFKAKNINVIGYDKYKNIGSLSECLTSEIIFLCLPTLFSNITNEYDKTCINEVCDILSQNLYKGLVVIKSTVEPQTISSLAKKYPGLYLVHNPEFLTSRTATEDFRNQRHIVLGFAPNVTDNQISKLKNFYHQHYPEAEISTSSSDESESMKIFVNSFYSVKIQFFNELYMLCQKINCNYDNVVKLMLKNNWINPMHTIVPGPDGKLSYGGDCFPKDTNALLNFMKKSGTIHSVLEASINERNIMRD